MATRKNFVNRKEKRRVEAKVRQENSDKLTVEQKLQKAMVGSQEYMRLLQRNQK